MTGCNTDSLTWVKAEDSLACGITKGDFDNILT